MATNGGSVRCDFEVCNGPGVRVGGSAQRFEGAAGVQASAQCHQGKEMDLERESQCHQGVGAIGQDDKFAVLAVAQRLWPAVLQSFQPAFRCFEACGVQGRLEALPHGRPEALRYAAKPNV